MLVKCHQTAKKKIMKTHTDEMGKLLDTILSIIYSGLFFYLSMLNQSEVHIEVFVFVWIQLFDTFQWHLSIDASVRAQL